MYENNFYAHLGLSLFLQSGILTGELALKSRFFPRFHKIVKYSTCLEVVDDIKNKHNFLRTI